MKSNLTLTKNGLLNLNSEKRRDLTRRFGRVVDEVLFLKGGVCCDIYLEKDSMVFSAIVGGDELSDKDGAKVKRWAYEQLEGQCNLQWLPVISVLDVGASEYSYNSRKLELHEIRIDLHRFYVAKMANGNVRAVEWSVPPEKRLTSHSVPSIWVSKADSIIVTGETIQPLHDKNTHILPYTDGLWNGLIKLCEGIDAMQERLHKLIQSEEGVLKLQSYGDGIIRMLQAPDNS